MAGQQRRVSQFHCATPARKRHGSSRVEKQERHRDKTLQRGFAEDRQGEKREHRQAGRHVREGERERRHAPRAAGSPEFPHISPKPLSCQRESAEGPTSKNRCGAYEVATSKERTHAERVPGRSRQIEEVARKDPGEQGSDRDDSHGVERELRHSGRRPDGSVDPAPGQRKNARWLVPHPRRRYRTARLP